MRQRAGTLRLAPSGETVKIAATAPEPNVLSIKISDAGAPIAEPAQVFDPEETTPPREPNINELGIIIGRKLIDLMGGSISLMNRDTVGLEAIIQLPARPVKG